MAKLATNERTRGQMTTTGELLTFEFFLLIYTVARDAPFLHYWD